MIENFIWKFRIFKILKIVKDYVKMILCTSSEALNDARDSANNRAERKIEMFLQASARKKRKCNFDHDTVEWNSKLDAKNDRIEV